MRTLVSSAVAGVGRLARRMGDTLWLGARELLPWYVAMTLALGFMLISLGIWTFLRPWIAYLDEIEEVRHELGLYVTERAGETQDRLAALDARLRAVEAATGPRPRRWWRDD